jgi:hypothetical protein
LFSIPQSCPKFDDFQVSSRLNFKSSINQALTSNLILNIISASVVKERSLFEKIPRTKKNK